jgi:hypothetical protein
MLKLKESFPQSRYESDKFLVAIVGAILTEIGMSEVHGKE